MVILMLGLSIRIDNFVIARGRDFSPVGLVLHLKNSPTKQSL